MKRKSYHCFASIFLALIFVLVSCSDNDPALWAQNVFGQEAAADLLKKADRLRFRAESAQRPKTGSKRQWEVVEPYATPPLTIFRVVKADLGDDQGTLRYDSLNAKLPSVLQPIADQDVRTLVILRSVHELGEATVSQRKGRERRVYKDEHMAMDMMLIDLEYESYTTIQSAGTEPESILAALEALPVAPISPPERHSRKRRRSR